LLQRRIDELKKFEPNSINKLNDPRINVLSQAIDEAIVRIFGPETIDYDRYHWVSHIRSGGLVMRGYGPSITEVREEVKEGIEKAALTLEGIILRFREELETTAPQAQNAASESSNWIDSGQIFVVHGHDQGARESVARFIERIGFEPIILHERPNKGRTIITKFREEASDVGFAIVLMTPDDHGAEAGVTNTKLRARQNVVFELGFFIGAFGPERVVAIVKGDVERPSDFEGVVYIDLDDAGAWKQKLGKELEAVGFNIDWNRVMKS